MAIEKIDHELCIGCGECFNNCPVDVIRMDLSGEKAEIRYSEDCMCCYACVLDCPGEAIHVSPDKFDPVMVAW